MVWAEKELLLPLLRRCFLFRWEWLQESNTWGLYSILVSASLDLCRLFFMYVVVVHLHEKCWMQINLCITWKYLKSNKLRTMSKMKVANFGIRQHRLVQLEIPNWVYHKLEALKICFTRENMFHSLNKRNVWNSFNLISKTMYRYHFWCHQVTQSFYETSQRGNIWKQRGWSDETERPAFLLSLFNRNLIPKRSSKKSISFLVVIFYSLLQ